MVDVGTRARRSRASTDGATPEAGFEQHRGELTGYCYRMLGSPFEAEDAVQETLVRAWRNFDRFEGRAAVRTWLYRIATNVCLDMLQGRQRRARPMDLGPASPVGPSAGEPLGESQWIQPIPDSRVGVDDDPAEVAVARETIRLAFVAALQHLPARQRAVLILRDVLRWKANEVADLLGTTVVSVNSALQRARATLAATDLNDPDADVGDDTDLLARYAAAFERYDVDELVALLHADATMTMPPYALWLQGRDDLRTFFLTVGAGCKGSRLVPIRANGVRGFAQYRPIEHGGQRAPYAIQLISSSGGRVTAIQTFHYSTLFPLFGLPERADEN